MKRVWGHVLGGVSLLGIGVGVIIMAACKSDDSTLFVQDVLAQQLVTPGQQCLYTADPTQATISSGVLDTALRSEYDATFLVGNQAVPEVNSQQLATETDIITIAGAIVRITDSDGNQLADYTRLAAATVYPSSGGVPGYAPITVTILDSGTVGGDAQLQSIIHNPPGNTYRLVTYVQFFGQTTGGTSVKSDTFEFPIDVCYTCLIGYTNDPAYTTPNCAGSSASTASSSTLPEPCIPGQDDGISCTQCSEAVCQCPAQIFAGASSCTGTSTVADGGTD